MSAKSRRPTRTSAKPGTKPRAKAKLRTRSQIRTPAQAAKPKVKPKRTAAVKATAGPPPVPAPRTIPPMPPRVIAAEADLHEGVRALRRKCPVMRAVHDLAGHPPLRRREAGFEGLARIIVGQQLSVASANAIWQRTFAAVVPFAPARLLALDDAQLAAAGLSRPKIRTLRAISLACVEGLDLARLDDASDAQVHTELTQVNGIGPWTADIFLMFCLGRADAWAAGDLALQIAAQQAFGLAERPSQQALLDLAERWRPWRGVAARLLWAYYAVRKEQAKTAALPL